MKEYIERGKLIGDILHALLVVPSEDFLLPPEKDILRMIKSEPAADVRPVVTCSDCKWWTKQESSLQGRCELLQMYPTGAWFCANGKREES